jgi:hypothetical protein
VQTVVGTYWHHPSLCFAVEQNVWKRQISTIHPISQQDHRYPSQLAYSPESRPDSITLVTHHVISCHFPLATTTAANQSSQSRPQITTHKQPPDLGSESASFSPAFLALSTAINQRLAEEQLHLYLYLEPKDSSTTVVVSSSGILLLS